MMVGVLTMVGVLIMWLPWNMVAVLTMVGVLTMWLHLINGGSH